ATDEDAALGVLHAVAGVDQDHRAPPALAIGDVVRPAVDAERRIHQRPDVLLCGAGVRDELVGAVRHAGLLQIAFAALAARAMRIGPPGFLERAEAHAARLQDAERGVVQIRSPDERQVHAISPMNQVTDTLWRSVRVRPLTWNVKVTVYVVPADPPL